MSGGFVKETYEALQVLFTSNSFEECIIKAVNRGHDADTTGAVAGMLAGRNYGLIFRCFKSNLMMFDEIYEIASKLASTDIKAF